MVLQNVIIYSRTSLTQVSQLKPPTYSNKMISLDKNQFCLLWKFKLVQFFCKQGNLLIYLFLTKVLDEAGLPYAIISYSYNLKEIRANV